MAAFDFALQYREGGFKLNMITDPQGYRLSVSLRLEVVWLANDILKTGWGSTDCTIKEVDEQFLEGKVKLTQSNSRTTELQVPKSYGRLAGDRCYLIHVDAFQQGQGEIFAYATMELV